MTIRIEKIGYGIQGVVYKVFDSAVKSPYVVKASFNDDDNERNMHFELYNAISCKRFVVKPIKLSATKRSKLLKLLSEDLEFDVTHIHAMEYINGVELYDFIKTASAQEYKTVRTKLHDAVLCMWQAGFIHSDLHFENVIVTRTPTGRVQIKLIDFGNATKRTHHTSKLTKSQLLQWFESQWQFVLNNQDISTGNPESIFLKFNANLAKLPYFSGRNKRLLQEKNKIHSRCAGTQIKNPVTGKCVQRNSAVGKVVQLCNLQH